MAQFPLLIASSAPPALHRKHKDMPKILRSCNNENKREILLKTRDEISIIAEITRPWQGCF